MAGAAWRDEALPRKPPTAAAGFVRWQDVSGTPELPAGTVLQRDDQQTYTTTEAAVAVGGVLRAPILADVAGREGNADDGIALRLVTPVGGYLPRAMPTIWRAGKISSRLKLAWPHHGAVVLHPTGWR